MPTIRRREVRQHRSRARLDGLRPGDPYLVAFLGVVFVVAGLAFVWSGWLLSGDRGLRGLLTEWRGFFGLALAAAGAALWIPLRRRHLGPARGRAASPDLAPWQTDSSWDPSGIGSDLDDLPWFRATWLFVATGLLYPLYRVGEWQVRLAVGLTVLVLGLEWAKVTYHGARRMKFGRSRLRFTHSPYLLGGELVVYLQDLDRLQGARKVTATLRFVGEELEWRRSGKGRRRLWIRYAYFEEVQSFEPGTLPFGAGAPARLLRFLRPADPEAELPLRFALPGIWEAPKNPKQEPRDLESFDTRLGENPPRYWELEVKAALPGIDYEALFLLPVYLPVTPEVTLSASRPSRAKPRE